MVYSILKRMGVIFCFAVLLGIYQFSSTDAHSILLSLICGIKISQVKGNIPYLELGKWLLVISFFVLLAVVKLKEKESIYFYELVRCGSRRWWHRLYGSILFHVFWGFCECVLIWGVFDCIFHGTEIFDFMFHDGLKILLVSIILLFVHILFLVSIDCAISLCGNRTEILYLPIFIEGLLLLLAEGSGRQQILFPGTWGMYNRSNIVDASAGFPAVPVLLIELVIILVVFLYAYKLAEVRNS